MIIVSAASKGECESCFAKCFEPFKTIDFSAFQDDAIVNAKTPEEALKQICRENQVICDGYDLCKLDCISSPCGCAAEKTGNADFQADFLKCVLDEAAARREEIRAAAKDNPLKNLEITYSQVPSKCLYSVCNKSNLILIILAIVGGVVVVIVLCLVLVCYCLLTNNKKDQQYAQKPQFQFVGTKPERDQYHNRR